jgi:hypothetical protein
MAQNKGKNSNNNYNTMYSDPWSSDRMYSEINNSSDYNYGRKSNSQFTERNLYNIGNEKGNISYLSPMNSPNATSSRVSQFSEGTFGPAGIFGS